MFWTMELVINQIDKLLGGNGIIPHRFIVILVDTITGTKEKWVEMDTAHYAE